MNKKTTLLSSCLILVSTTAIANRPAMDDHRPSAEPAPVETPAAAPVTTQEVAPQPESAVELGMRQQPVQQYTEQQQIGDALELQSGETLPVQLLEFPRRGMTMDKVQNEMGEPLSISETVGEPPITGWSYNDRTVYFEHSTVLHVVAN